MHKKFEMNQTKIKSDCPSGRKVVTHNSKSDLPLIPIKIGDYGLAEERHPQDYICVDNGLKPKQSFALRWLAPEFRERILCAVKNSDLRMSPVENLWTLGITLWEVATLARYQPFRQVTDQCFRTLTASIGPELLGPIDLEVRRYTYLLMFLIV